MRYLLSKSKYILILSFFTAFFITIAFSNIVKAFHLTGKSQDLLSTSYYSYAVPDGTDVETLLTLAEQYRNSGTLILRYKENGTCGVYATGREFTPKMSSGRSFLESDFQSHSRIAIVSDTSTDQLRKIDGRSCILIDNQYFEVIGTFSRSDNIVNRDATVYYNLSAYKTEKPVKLSGQYALDAGTDSAQLAADFQNAFHADSIHTPEDLSFKNRLHTAMFNQAITIMPLILVVLMILLNSINVTLNWIDKRKNELITRKICGATTSELMVHLSRDYILLVTISYLFGFAAVAVASHFITSAFFVGFDLSPVTFVISLITTLLIGMIAIIIMILSSNMKTITEQRGA